jgi:prophage regulatory protein
VGWPAHEVAALNAARIAGKADAEIRALVTHLEAARKAVA